MTYPASDVNTTNADATGDNPSLFRVDALDLITKFNLLRNHISTLGQTLLNRATAALMRTDLGAAASGANTDITSLASPALGAATATTQAAGDNSTKVSTTAFVLANTGKQIQSITASVAANAITITLNPTTLDFRNTTRTNGAITSVALASAATLTIAAPDSFGAVTADGTRRIAILAINNAGTIELAASSLAGGVNLDETGVITTAATATTLTGIKAANVRTGVAYRVVGFVDAIYTTTVGWGSLSLVQGAGGNAATAFGSLGYGQTWQNVTGSRATGTTYYNTTGKPILVSSTWNIALQGAYMQALVNSVVIQNSDMVGSGAGLLNLLFLVPTGSSYSVVASSGSPTASIWSELS